MDLKEAIRAVRPAVVQIQDASRTALGTGFFIDENAHVATALHVVAKLHAPMVMLAHADARGFSGVDAAVVARDDRHDLAILRMTRNPFAGDVSLGAAIGGTDIEVRQTTATIDAARPDDGEAIAISGYPLANSTLVTTSGAIAAASSYDIYAKPVPWAPPGLTRPDFADVYLADVQANPGNSGGPAYRIADAVIIGVCIRTSVAPTFDSAGSPTPVFANAGLAVIRPARYLAELAKGLQT
jgi:S1-C subfamily serine protease